MDYGYTAVIPFSDGRSTGKWPGGLMSPPGRVAEPEACKTLASYEGCNEGGVNA